MLISARSSTLNYCGMRSKERLGWWRHENGPSTPPYEGWTIYGPGDIRVEDIPEPAPGQGQVKIKVTQSIVPGFATTHELTSTGCLVRKYHDFVANYTHESHLQPPGMEVSCRSIGQMRLSVEHCFLVCGSDLHAYLMKVPIYASTEPHELTGETVPVTLGHE